MKESKKSIAGSLAAVFLIVVLLSFAIALAVNIASVRKAVTYPTTELSTIVSPSTSEPTITTASPTTSANTSTRYPETTTGPRTTTSVVTTVTTTVTTVAEPPEFVLDLSEYEKYMNPTGEDWDDIYLLLVNAANPIGKDQELTYPTLANIISSKEIKEYKYSRFMDINMNETALRALTAMILEAKAEGISDLYVVSDYRNYDKQNTVFYSNVRRTYRWECKDCDINWVGKDNKCPTCGKTASGTLPITQEEKEKNVATYSCRPGTSDHQTGLVVDMVQTSLPSKYLHLIQEFGETEAGKWLEENCTKFGFILRFPKDKEDVTGIIYEPWHFRFVGRYHAEKMRELNMCLEEYTVYLNNLKNAD